LRTPLLTEIIGKKAESEINIMNASLSYLILNVKKLNLKKIGIPKLSYLQKTGPNRIRG
jgi:hypothetical protein